MKTNSQEKQIIIADRSTLERFAKCPRAGVWLSSGEHNTHSEAANSGSFGWHEMASRVIAQYIEMGGHPGTGVGELVAMCEAELSRTRPDVQPDAIDGGRLAIWNFARLIQPLAVSDFIGFDGGVGGKCSQYAADIEVGDKVVRVTGEMDLLLANEASPEIVDLYDWKTGRGTYDEGDVFHSFQFRCYAWLIFQKFKVESVRAQVWNTRIGTKTRWVYFHRERDERNLYGQIRAAAETYAKHWQNDDAPAWPSREKCLLCDCVLKCSKAGANIVEIATSPTAFVDHIAALESQVESLKEQAKAWVDAHGDIVTPNGNAFGRSKPKADRKAPATLYECSPDHTVGSSTESKTRSKTPVTRPATSEPASESKPKKKTPPVQTSIHF